MNGSWKYSKAKLSRHKFCANIIHPKKVICIYGKTVKLNQKWDEDYLNRHANENDCNRKLRQKLIYCFFKFSFKKRDNDDGISSNEEYNSNIFDDTNSDDIILVDAEQNDDNTNNVLLSEDENQPNIRKRIHCLGLQVEWKIDHDGNCVRAKNCTGDYIENSLCINCEQLKSNSILANHVAIKKPNEKIENLHQIVILKSISPHVLDLFQQNLAGRSIQSI
ncbi:1027_t:CDS:2, partial [Funneliformis geosporum]